MTISSTYTQTDIEEYDLIFNQTVMFTFVTNCFVHSGFVGLQS